MQKRAECAQKISHSTKTGFLLTKSLIHKFWKYIRFYFFFSKLFIKLFFNKQKNISLIGKN